MPVCGNKSVVERCLNSLLPIHEHFDLYIYNSEISDQDGTTAFLIEKQKEYGFNLICGKTLRHWEAVDVLMSHVKSQWILHLDSDVFVLDKNIFNVLSELTLDKNIKVHGMVQQNHFVPTFRPVPSSKNMLLKLLLPRVYSWMVLFDRQFYNSNDVDFKPMRINVRDKFQIISKNTVGVSTENDEYKCPAHLPPEFNNQPINLTIIADTAWKLYWSAMQFDVFSRFSDTVIKSFIHFGASSVTWKGERDRERREKIVAERNALNEKRIKARQEHFKNRKKL